MKAKELKANELRIGNIVTRFGLLVKVTKTSIEPSGSYIGGNYLDNGSTWDIEDSFDATELNGDFLKRFGFIQDEYHGYWTDGSPFILREDFVLCDLDITIKVAYVHQLQNLYFCLTGKELTLK